MNEILGLEDWGYRLNKDPDGDNILHVTNIFLVSTRAALLEDMVLTRGNKTIRLSLSQSVINEVILVLNLIWTGPKVNILGQDGIFIPNPFW